MLTQRSTFKAILLTLLLAGVVFIPEISAQKNNSISLRYGPGFYARQDQTFSPFVHSDFSWLNVGLTYYRQAKMTQFADIQLGTYKPIIVPPYEYDDDKETYPHNFTLVNITYGFGKKLNKPEGNKSLTVGGLFEADIEASSYNYGLFGSFGYFASFSLAPWAVYEYKLDDKNSFSARAALPLFSLLARSPYLVNDDEFIENTYSHNGLKTFFAYIGDGKFQTLNRIQQFELYINYKRELSEKWQAGAIYEFRFIHASRPTNFLSYRNGIYAFAAFKF